MDFDTSKPTPRSVFADRAMPNIDEVLRLPNEPHRHYFLRVRETSTDVDEDTVKTEFEYKCLCGERVIP